MLGLEFSDRDDSFDIIPQVLGTPSRSVLMVLKKKKKKKENL